MKTEKSILSVKQFLPGMIAVFAALVFFSSCKKGSVETRPVTQDNMVEAAEVLSGELHSGSVTIESNDKEVAFNYNNGDKLILVEKIYSPDHIDFANSQSTQLITSPYGIILKDLRNNGVRLLMNNDSESMKKFEAVKDLFKTFKSEIIFGTTVINVEKV